jgi:[ribosomal protein S18]-alanine N-acetyltransferase
MKHLPPRCQEENADKWIITCMVKDTKTRSAIGQQDRQTMVFRSATESDLRAVLTIEQNASFHPWTEAAFRSELTNPYSRLWVLEEGALILGYVCAWFIHDEGQLANIAVLPEYRRRGLGRALIDHVFCEARQRGIRSLSLEVRRSNQAALELYKSLGFQEVSVRVRYYRNGEDALLMVCAISHL